MDKLAKPLWYVGLTALVLLGINTGLVKLGIGPADGVAADARIFAGIGFPSLATALFGALQALLALGLVVRRTRSLSAIGLAATFTVATGALFVDGTIAFGFASILFIVLALVFAAWPTAPRRAATSDVQVASSPG